MKIKICCISSVAEAKMAIAHGASTIGLVGSMPSGPGIIDNNLIREIAQNMPTTVDTFLLTSETDASKIIEHHRNVNTTAIQLVDEVTIATYSTLRKHLPNVKIIQVIHVIDEHVIPYAKRLSKFVNMLLLDSGNPNKAIKELGGTGRVHNWNISKRIVEEVGIPVFLAGGLNPQNIKVAIGKVKPAGIDVCSGVRTNSQLDLKKLTEFIEAIKTIK